MTTLAEVETALKENAEQRKALEKRRDSLLGTSLVTCKSNCYGQGCGAALPIGKLTYVQTHYYVSPSGCSGGDYWVPGEGQFDCPVCGHRNRLSKDVDALSRVFAKRVTSHDDQGRPPKIDDR